MVTLFSSAAAAGLVLDAAGAEVLRCRCPEPDRHFGFAGRHAGIGLWRDQRRHAVNAGWQLSCATGGGVERCGRRRHAEHEHRQRDLVRAERPQTRRRERQRHRQYRADRRLFLHRLHRQPGAEQRGRRPRRPRQPAGPDRRRGDRHQPCRRCDQRCHADDRRFHLGARPFRPGAAGRRQSSRRWPAQA